MPTILGPKPDMTEMFENVINYVGRVFVCDRDCKQDSITDVENCRGTVGLVGSSGESVGCWHTVKPATEKRSERYKIYIEYPNYMHNLMYEARIKDNLFNPELDLFIAEPVESLPYETQHLSCALDVSLADPVHCFGFPEVVDRQIVASYRNRKRDLENFVDSEVERRLRLPTIFSGRVCFNGWKQAVADYLCFPNCSGGIVVDDWGRLQGVHVAAFRVGRKLNFPNLEVAKTKHAKKGKSKPEQKINLRRSLKNLYQGVNSFCSETACTLNSCRNEVAAFVPVQIFEEPLELARLRQNKWKGGVKPSLIKSVRESPPMKSRLLEDERPAKRVKGLEDERPRGNERGKDEEESDKKTSKQRRREESPERLFSADRTRDNGRTAQGSSRQNRMADENRSQKKKQEAEPGPRHHRREEERCERKDRERNWERSRTRCKDAIEMASRRYEIDDKNRVTKAGEDKGNDKRKERTGIVAPVSRGKRKEDEASVRHEKENDNEGLSRKERRKNRRPKKLRRHTSKGPLNLP